MGKKSIFDVPGLYAQGTVQVTFSATNQDRSESTLATDPTNPNNLICASKKFVDPHQYRFTLAASWSSDGGDSWADATIAFPKGWEGATDPCMAFSPDGNTAYFICGPIDFAPYSQPVQNPTDTLNTVGVYVFTSHNKGKSWGSASRLDIADPTDLGDDKQWIVVDNSPASPYSGRAYVAWGANFPLRFARSLNGGATWTGVGAQAAGARLFPNAGATFAPEISTTSDGTVHIVWHIPGSSDIVHSYSSDGGETFSSPDLAASGITDLNSPGVPKDGGDSFHHLPGAQFRVLTLMSSCGVTATRFCIAWADYRLGVSRIFVRFAEKSGTNWVWLGPKNGTAVLPSYPISNKMHHLMPEIVTSADGTVGCAFYELGPKGGGTSMMDVCMVSSVSQGDTFEYFSTISDKPWDPAINAPWSHGNAGETFIGDYFGLDAVDSDFGIVWTGTQTGTQELYYSRIATSTRKGPRVPDLGGTIYGGVAVDGGGWIVVNGHAIRIPPRGPREDLLRALIALHEIEGMSGAGARHAAAGVIESMLFSVKELGKSVESH